jgi:hypothetical protein
MNQQQRAVVQWALEAFTTLRGACAAAGWLTDSEHIDHMDNSREAITALRQLLKAKPKQEPVAITEADIQKWQGDHDVVMSIKAYKQLVKMVSCKPAQPADWIDLSVDQKMRIHYECEDSISYAIELTLAKLREKNGGAE